jgi:hypothetical protein
MQVFAPTKGNLYLKVEIALGKQMLRQVKDFYGSDDLETVEAVLKDILDRYFTPEYFQDI